MKKDGKRWLGYDLFNYTFIDIMDLDLSQIYLTTFLGIIDAKCVLCSAKAIWCFLSILILHLEPPEASQHVGLPSSLRGSAPAGSRYMMLFYYIFSPVWLYHFCLLHTCMFMVFILTLYISLKYIVWFFKLIINLHTFILQRLKKDQIISS